MTTMKPAQLLIIEPANELKFVGPFRTAVASYMRLTNPTDHVLLFKIKTTAPKKYCVRPNSGTLSPKETTEITIILQPFTFDAAEKNKHKFMVQSMIKPDRDDYESPEQLWKEVSPENLMDSKLRCVFELPMESGKPTAAGSVLTSATVPMLGDSQPSSVTPNKPDSGRVGDYTQHGGNASDDEAPDLLSLLTEVKKLREAESDLRHENFMLKEKLLRVERETIKEQPHVAPSSLPVGSDAVSASAAKVATAAHYPNPYSPPPLAMSQPLPVIYVAAAIAMAIFGLILGKFVL